MAEKQSALHSCYIIDGILQELTPARMLDECMVGKREAPESAEGQIIDESVEPMIVPAIYDDEKVHYYISRILNSASAPLQPAFAGFRTRSAIATALIDTLWYDGRFRLGDLSLRFEWDWNREPLGAMAAFYASAEAASDYTDGLGVKICSYDYRPAPQCGFSASLVGVRSIEDEDDLVGALPYHIANPAAPLRRCYEERLLPDEKSWIMFIPMETCGFRLGGSRFCEAMGTCPETAPELRDCDYFNDCYELLRELSEDGIILSGTTVGEGGLATALKRMTRDCGAEIDLSQLKEAYEGSGLTRLLFSEVPGVLIQVEDIDYDYIDAEMLLQDVVYFPLGHPVPGSRELIFASSPRSGIHSILESLIRSQSSEGED